MDIEQVFGHHELDDDQIAAVEAVRVAAKALAQTIDEHVPAGADRAAAIRHVRDAAFTANAGISLRGAAVS